MAAREKTKQAAGRGGRAAAGRQQEEVDSDLARAQRRLGARGAAERRRRRRGWRRRASRARARKHLLLPGPDGALAGAVLGLGEARAGDPMDKPELAVGPAAGRAAARLLSPGRRARRAASSRPSPGASAPTASGATSRPSGEEVAQLKAAARRRPRPRARRIVEAVWLGRDLINTPASDMGPQELEDAARQLAKTHGADVSSIVGDDLLAKNFPHDPCRRPRQRRARRG